MQVEIPSRQAAQVYFPQGIHYQRSQKGRLWNIPDRRKRGKGGTFNRHSALRMKKGLLSVPTLENVWGITFTLRKDVYKGDSDKFRKFWQNYLNALRRSCDGWSWMFWRVELQLNGTPHYHVIISAKDYNIIRKIQDKYLSFVKKYYNDIPPPDVAVVPRRIDGFDQAFAYVSSHATKHKREQLGWQGRQWGTVFKSAEDKVIFRNSLTGLEVRLLDNASYEEVIFKRILRKLYYSRKRLQGQFKTVIFKRSKWKNDGFPVRSVRCSSRWEAKRMAEASVHFLPRYLIEQLKGINYGYCRQSQRNDQRCKVSGISKQR